MGVNSLQWYHVPSLGRPGESVILTGDEWHHCFHVLRFITGDNLILTDGRGQCMEGLIKSTSQREGLIELTHDRQDEFRKPYHFKLSIGMAPTKNIDRTEFAIEKLVELGVDEICFLECKHAERTRIRMDRFEKIMISAAKQSRKISFPALKDLTPPIRYIEQVQADQPAVNIVCCHLDSSSRSLDENYIPGSNVVMLIGPEGGFSDDELKHFTGSGVRLVNLGPYRLRVETAAITACANIHLLHQMNNRT